MLVWLLRRLPGWNSIHITEKAHERIEFYGLMSLVAMFFSELLAYLLLDKYRWPVMLGIVALGCLVIVEYVGLKYGKRLKELERIEAADKDRKRKAELSELRSDAAESSIIAQIADEASEKAREIETALAKQRAARHLSEKAREFIKQSISKYAPQKFQIIVPSFGDGEANGFAMEIESALKECRWEGYAICNFKDASQWIHINTGVGVWENHKADADTIESGGNLRCALHNVGVAGASMGRIGGGGRMSLDIPKDTVEIVVGRKPEPGEIRAGTFPPPM